ncbi:MAG: DUF4345 domain-containing protein [Pseudomonadota bacterium]
MNITRLYLLVAGLAFAGLGIFYLGAPIDMARLTDFMLFSHTGIVEVQGFYGGQMLGIGVALLLAVRRSWLVLPGLVLVAATLGGTALGRLYGMVTGGEWPVLMIGLFALEIASAALAVYLIQRERPGASS